jgi:hypothetical protein
VQALLQSVSRWAWAVVAVVAVVLLRS